jgi:hypothetical protein
MGDWAKVKLEKHWKLGLGNIGRHRDWAREKMEKHKRLVGLGHI